MPPITEATRRRIDGKRNAEIMPILFERPLSAEEVTALAWEKEEMYREFSRGGLQPIRGLSELLDALESQGIPTAVATSAPRENVVHTLGELGLADRFGAVALSDEVPRGKPFLTFTCAPPRASAWIRPTAWRSRMPPSVSRLRGRPACDAWRSRPRFPPRRFVRPTRRRTPSVPTTWNTWPGKGSG